MSAFDLSRLTGVITPPTDAQLASGWHRLPGGRLELRDTGFAITLCRNPGCQPYHLHDGEGRLLASHSLLQPLKQHAELHAADRAEFG